MFLRKWTGNQRGNSCNDKLTLALFYCQNEILDLFGGSSSGKSNILLRIITIKVEIELIFFIIISVFSWGMGRDWNIDLSVNIKGLQCLDVPQGQIGNKSFF